MELKLQINYEAVNADDAFNRTILELKRSLCNYFCNVMLTFNRTILELKRSSAREVSSDEGTFNRTILELKLKELTVKAVPTTLLIVPFWNWNPDPSSVNTMPSVLLIVPFWNWNTAQSIKKYINNNSFNRTILELKLDNYLVETLETYF